MRTLLILGGLVVCVLLVTPSNGDPTESQDGGEKGTSNLREFIGQNEDRRANGIDAESSSTIDRRAQLRLRRQEPSSLSNGRKRKKCPGCFSSISIDEPLNRNVPKPKRSRREQEPSSLSNGRKWKKCPGCFSSLSIDEPLNRNVPTSKRSRREDGSAKRKPKKPKPLPKKPKPLPNRFSLGSAPDQDPGTPEEPPKDESRTRNKKIGRKHSREEKEERKRRKHHHHPEGEKEEKKKKLDGSSSPIPCTVGERKEDLSDGKGAAERMKRQSDKKKKKDRKEGWRSGSRSLIASLPSSKTDTMLCLA